MSPKISVIVPVYNVEKYLNQCVDSILCQTYKNFELILVDDGSTDSSGKICDNYASSDNRVKVIHQKNTGGARGGVMSGCAAACGEYIYMVDSDDFISPVTLETLLSNIEKYDADCVQYQAIYLNDGVETKYYDQKFEIIENTRLKKEVVEEYMKTGSTSHTQWSYGRHDKFYKTELIKKVLPHLDINVTLCEDIEMSLWVALYCRKFVVLENCHLYYWRFVTNSISRKMVNNTISKHIYFLNALKKFGETNNISCDALPDISDRIYLDLMITALSRNIPVFQKASYLNELKKLVNNKNNILSAADSFSAITKYSLKYLITIDCFVPSLLSQLYIKTKK